MTKMTGAPKILVGLGLLSLTDTVEAWVSLNAISSADVIYQHVVGDISAHTDTNHIAFQDDWQLYSAGGLFEIRSHVGSAVDAESVDGTMLPRLTLDKQGNIVVRNAGNNISASVVGAAILGGGTVEAPNIGYDSFVVISGGQNNQAGSSGTDVMDAAYATISGGSDNTASALGASICGGVGNSATGSHAVAAGGNGNTASAAGASVGGDISDGTYRGHFFAIAAMNM